MFKKFLRGAQQIQSQNMLEAIVAGCMLVAAADGTVERAEIDKMDKLLTTDESLKAFKPADIRKLSQRYQTRLEADFGLGQMQMLKEIGDISDNADQAEQVLLTMLAIAKSDGEIEPAERVVLDKVARSLGLDVNEYL